MANTSIFYTLHLKGPKYTFLFEKDGVRVGYIVLDETPHKHVEVTLHIEDGVDLAQHERDGMRALADDVTRLRNHAFAMTREYLQGESGELLYQEPYGQMLFGMDLEDFDNL